jgi:hypothetical protein
VVGVAVRATAAGAVAARSVSRTCFAALRILVQHFLSSITYCDPLTRSSADGHPLPGGERETYSPPVATATEGPRVSGSA